MNYQTALANYKDNSSKENLNKQVEMLVNSMSTKEKIKMMMGDNFMKVMLKGLIKEGRVYNIEPITSGGCKRLGIDNGIKFTDGPRGVVMGNSTCFPVAMLRGATFDDDLEQEIGIAMANEAIAQGANYFAGICINLVRNPKWGRCQESYGEDQYMLGNMGVALTNAMQQNGVVACIKHFALNSIEDLRFYIDVKCSDKVLHEIYLPHFKKCIDAGALSVMGAYNKVNGQYCCANEKLMTTILREQWGFDGLTISDFVWGVTDAKACVNAGCDIEMPMPSEYKKVNRLLKKGEIKIESINKSVSNILSVMLRMDGKQKAVSKDVVCCNKHTELSRYAATQGMVLLENNGLLPLAKDANILVCGEYADTVNVGDKGSSSVHSPYCVTAYQGIQNNFDRVHLCNGRAAKDIDRYFDSTDVAIVNVGFDYRTEGEFVVKANINATTKKQNKGGDRDSLHLCQADIALIKKLKQNNKKVVAVIYSGAAVLVEDIIPYCDAIVMNFYAGLEGGNALAEILCGETNPSGKLPFTVAKDQDDYVPFKHLGQQPYVIDYNYYHGYTHFEKNNIMPRYEFGYGLSYTTFELANLIVEQSQQNVIVNVDVNNIGDTKGKEVVQVYIGSDRKDIDRPIKQLKGYKKVEVESNSSARVQITIPIDELRFYNQENGSWQLDTDYVVYVGNSSQTSKCLKQNLKEVSQ